MTDIDAMLIKIAVVIAVISSLLTGLVIFCVPYVWNLIKPWLHAISS
jgi:uncharacterized membrane-anchored protein